MENNSQTKGNKGEWSELYALAYLLVNGGAHSADENQAPITDEYFRVLQVVLSNRDLQDELKYEIKEETIEIFENEFVASNYKDDMVKFLLWDDFLRAYYEDKTEIITLSKILNQINIVKSAKEGLLKTEEEITKIHNFFSK